MGGKAAKALTHADIREELKDRYNELSEKDQNLVHFAITQITKQSKKMKLKSVAVSLNFSDNTIASVQSDDNPDNSYVVTHNGEGGFHGCWETESTKRYVFRLFSKSLDQFLTWLGDITRSAASGIGGVTRKAITY